VKVSRETLRKWMVEDGAVAVRARQRRSFISPVFGARATATDPDRWRDHRWFEERGAACSLLVFIDDATAS